MHQPPSNSPLLLACASHAQTLSDCHGASSSRKVYRSSFIPGLHDVCMVFERA